MKLIFKGSDGRNEPLRIFESITSKRNTLVTPAGQNCVNTTKLQTKNFSQTNANVLSIIYEMQLTNHWIALNMPSLLSFVCFMEGLAKQSNKRLTTTLFLLYKYFNKNVYKCINLHISKQFEI